MKKITFLLILMFGFLGLFAVNNLYVLDPRVSWQSNPGTIEEISLDIKPKGLYMEYGLYMTFSSRQSKWTTVKDTVEVVLDFELPRNSIVIDSWLWIGKDIKRADILDRWKASQIYESIVKRRKDPSILYKQGNNQYQLRIFPMAGNETRKAKITWLVPVTWNKLTAYSGLPMEIVNSTSFFPKTFQVSAWNQNGFISPFILGDESLKFESKSDPVKGNYKAISIPYDKFIKTLKVGYESPAKKGYYFSRFNDGQQGYYQLALFPTALLDSVQTKKVAVLVDYDAANSKLSIPEILNIVKLQMQNNLKPGDSFNLIFSNLAINRHSEKWVEASSVNIESAFHVMGNNISKYSNLAQLLVNGIEFVKKNGNDGKIILVSNADQYSDVNKANSLIKDLIGLMKPEIQIHISDYQNMDYPYMRINNIYYTGNDYFYTNLSKLTTGSYHRVLSGITEEEVVSLSFKYLYGSINSFDLHTKLKTGFCFSRYTLADNAKIAYVNDVITQIGKYKGTFPFEIEFSGEYNRNLISKSFTVNESEVAGNDSILEEIWTGQFINEMEKIGGSNEIISEIVKQSINERVLSYYTAFLCVEGDLPVLDAETKNRFTNTGMDGALTGTNEKITKPDSIMVFPNPFRDLLTIQIRNTNPESIKELVLYDMNGSLIHKFNPDIFRNQNDFVWNTITSDGSRLKQGVYFLVMKTGYSVKTVKLIRN